MSFKVFCVVALSFSFCAHVLCEEKEAYGFHEHDHPEGADTFAFDHEAFLGSRKLVEEFSMLRPDEAKDRLLVIAQEMDSDNDGMLTREELAAALAQNFMRLDEEDAAERLPDVDSNKDGNVDWEEYVQNTYQTTPTEMDELVANTSLHSDPKVKATVTAYQNDQLRFQLADLDKDGKLSLIEFAAFSHPYDYEHMVPAEVKHTIQSYDVDGDGKISLHEYLRDDASGGPQSEEWLRAEQDRFNNEIDKNKDGFLDEDEVQAWIAPSLMVSSRDEAGHLLGIADIDNDGALSQEELLNSYHVLVGGSDEVDEDFEQDHDEL